MSIYNGTSYNYSRKQKIFIMKEKNVIRFSSQASSLENELKS